MKTLAQQYQDLLNFIDSAHSLKLSDIANICENATMEFCQNLPSEFDYKVSYSEYDESVEIVANVKGQSERTFSVTKGMIARLNTNDCYFAKRLASYKESLNIEVLSENAQKLRLEKQEVAKEEEQQEEEVYTDLINFFERLISDYPNLSYVSFFKHFSTKEIQHFNIRISDDIDSMQEGNLNLKIKSPSTYMVDVFNGKFPNFEYISRDSFDIIVKKEQSKQEVKEQQQEVKEQLKEELYSDIQIHNLTIKKWLEECYEDCSCIKIEDIEYNSNSYQAYYECNGKIWACPHSEYEFSVKESIAIGMYIERRNQLNKK